MWSFPYVPLPSAAYLHSPVLPLFCPICTVRHSAVLLSSCPVGTVQYIHYHICRARYIHIMPCLDSVDFLYHAIHSHCVMTYVCLAADYTVKN